MKFTSIVCAAILFAAFSSQGNAAQTVSAPVLLSQSTEPTGAYYEQNGHNSCTGSSGTSSGASGSSGTATVCKIDFAAAPTGKYLVIEHVACNLVSEVSKLADISLATASGTNDIRLVPLEPMLGAEGGGYYYYSVNDSVLYVTRSVPRIVMHLIDPGVLDMTCQISGHLNVNK